MMKFRPLWRLFSLSVIAFFAFMPTAHSQETKQTSKAATKPVKALRVGIIGLDTPHASAFTKRLNDPDAPPELANCKVIAAYPKGSPDIKTCLDAAPKCIKIVKGLGVEIVETIPELLKRVDVVLLETQDGRPHLEQVLPVLKAGKPVFVDKPVAGSLADAVAIYAAAKKYKTPIFSSSSLRYMKGLDDIRSGKFGKVDSCYGYSPCPIEKTHPDIFWYGIHGVEIVCTAMGTGCESVVRVHNPDTDVVVGTWNDNRTGTFLGRRKPNNGYFGGYGGIVIGPRKTKDIGNFTGYDALLVEVVKFFRTEKPPVSAEATLEIYAFMEAADESKRQNGKRIFLKDVMKKAYKDAGLKPPE